MFDELIYKNKFARYPRLDTVLMVERIIKKYDGEFTMRGLWKHLPRKIMWQTFCLIIDYLMYSNKISIDSKEKIGWIFYPESVKKKLKERSLFWNDKTK